MDQGQAKGIFDEHIKKSKINLAHLYTCHLVKDGYVDCILTTNFDPLIIRTLSIYGINPTIYDLTVSRDNVSSDLSYPAVVYLHGQNNGFWRLNSDGEFDIAKSSISKTLQKEIINRPMIVVGYSGNNDPVFDQLSAIDSFTDGLYWVAYKDHDPGNSVKEKLLDKHTNGSYWIKGYDADQFFLNLRNYLKKELPDILNKPFSHLIGLIDNIAEIKIDDNPWEALVQVKKDIDETITKYEQEPNLLKLLNEIWISNDFERMKTLVKNSFKTLLDSENSEIKYAASSVFYNWGTYLGILARLKTGKEQKELYKLVFEKYENAISINPYNPDVYFNIACLFAVQNKSEESIEYLKKTIDLDKENSFNKSIILKDRDFDNIKKTPEFISFLDKTFGK